MPEAAAPEPLPAQPHASSIEDVLTTLVASGVLETLDIESTDLERARNDADLQETLTITYELLMAFDDSGVLDTFFRLSKGDQANFLRWIGSTDNPEIRARRTETFVSALETAPLASGRSPREAGRRRS